ncbi:hypothetical protein 10KY502B_gene0038 [Xanthomonas phage 10KY502B]|nr:hypothetical protein 10KY502B_gene0038 [Xanthomonas phage 10KY502B]
MRGLRCAGWVAASLATVLVGTVCASWLGGSCGMGVAIAATVLALLMVQRAEATW